MKTRCPEEPDRGFTLIEVIVAMVITAVVMSALAYAVVGSLSTIQQARQRQTATGLATQQLERLRALPYDLVTQPDPAAPTVAVDYTTTNGSGTKFAPPTRLVPGGVNEVLVVNTVSGKTVTQQVGNVTYAVETYVTKAALTPSGSQPFNLTAIVKWTSSVSHGQREMVQRSTTYSSSGCLSTANSPFAAPCQAYYTVRAGEALSGVTISSVAGADQPIAGMDGKQLQLDLSHTSANLLVEQTASGTAAAVTSGAAVTGSSTTTNTGNQSAGATVDSDPSSLPNQSVSVNTPAQTSTTLTTSGAGGTLAVRPFGSDSGNARAAVSAPSSLCTNANGTALVTGVAGSERPCSASNLITNGSGAVLTYTDPTGTALTFANFSPAAAASRAVAALIGTTNAGVCSSGTLVDCGHAAASRQMGASTFGAASFTSAPSGFDPARGLWKVSGITESVTAEEGAGALLPANPYSRSGDIDVWDGTTYQHIVLGNYAAQGTPVSQTWTVPSTVVQYGASLSVEYSGSLTVQRPSTTRTAAVSPRTGNVATDCKSAPCTTTVDGSGAVRAQVTMIVRSGATELTRFAVSVDLGGLTANSSYKAAANA